MSNMHEPPNEVLTGEAPADRREDGAGAGSDVREELALDPGVESGTDTLIETPMPVAPFSAPDQSVHIFTREAIEHELAAIAALPDNLQMKAAVELSKKFFGSREVAEQFIKDLAAQVADGTWDVGINFNPNGFFKVSLGKVGGVALRLHFNSQQVEIPEGGRIEENVHDHRWSFVSTLLTGSFVHTLYKLGDGSDSRDVKLHKFSYAPRGGKEDFEMEYIGTEHVREIKTTAPLQFKQFSMPATCIHRAAYPLQETEPTVTAVITFEDRGRTFNYVWTTDEIKEQIDQSGGTTPTPKVEAKTASTLLDELLDQWKRADAERISNEV